MESFSIFFSSLDTISLPLGHTLLPCLLKSVKSQKIRSVFQTKVQLLFIFLTQIIKKFGNPQKKIPFFQFQSRKKIILKKIPILKFFQSEQIIIVKDTKQTKQNIISVNVISDTCICDIGTTEIFVVYFLTKFLFRLF